MTPDEFDASWASRRGGMLGTRVDTHVDVRDATHVVLMCGCVHRIVSKWGIAEDGRLAKPSAGGFGVVTEQGQRVSMWEAGAYLRLRTGNFSELWL